MIQTQICASLFLLCGASGGSSNAAHHLRAPGRSWGVLRAVVGGLGRVSLRKTKRMQHKFAIRCDLEPSWAHLGPSWATLGAILGPSWRHLWAILGPSWGHFWPTCAILADLKAKSMKSPKVLKSLMKINVLGLQDAPNIGQIRPRERPSWLQDATLSDVG